MNVVDLRIIRGEAFAGSDIAMSGKGDPYVVVKVANKIFKTKKK